MARPNALVKSLPMVLCLGAALLLACPLEGLAALKKKKLPPVNKWPQTVSGTVQYHVYYSGMCGPAHVTQEFNLICKLSLDRAPGNSNSTVIYGSDIKQGLLVGSCTATGVLDSRAAVSCGVVDFTSTYAGSFPLPKSLLAVMRKTRRAVLTIEIPQGAIVNNGLQYLCGVPQTFILPVGSFTVIGAAKSMIFRGNRLRMAIVPSKGENENEFVMDPTCFKLSKSTIKGKLQGKYIKKSK